MDFSTNPTWHSSFFYVYMFNKINKELYILINNNKFINLNYKLSQRAEIEMHINYIYDLYYM
jgi:hypothetical protein